MLRVKRDEGDTGEAPSLNAREQLEVGAKDEFANRSRQPNAG
jgi:hypothetical protein